MNYSIAQVESMPAGPELNMLIMEHVLGYRWVYTDADVPWMRAGVAELKPANWYKNADTLDSWVTLEGITIHHGKGREQLVEDHWSTRYSSDIALAWKVLEKIADTGIDVRVWPALFVQPRTWCCSIGGVSIGAETAALAICRAALSALLMYA